MTKRIAVVNREKCNPEGCGGYLCIRVCPVNREEKDCIVQAEDNKVDIAEGLCIGCQICVKKCPFDAISILNLPEELNDDPIHRYGKNMFAMFYLPIPKFAHITGILGVNGIGKSTALKILAGVTKPNFGKKADFDFSSLIEFFKGSEAQGYFEKVHAGDIRVAYKPQNVDLIPQQTKGTVEELLRSADEKGMFDQMITDFELQTILGRDISALSGGELQKVAIVATLMKDANVYVIDEPTSYLDIKQRLKFAHYIREFINEDNSVLIIEHDLIALDYMTDLVQIMYGKTGVFGIASQPRSTKQAINTYLDGYLREENVRFRDHKITFDVKPPFEAKQKELLIEWPELQKSFGSFSLSIQSGEIRKHEKIGIIGENGIGKTSFVKLLAGVEKPDSGKIDTKVKVSYKPQYIDNTSEEIVMNVLSEALGNFHSALVKPLGLDPLLEKQINQLSGGELQRVAIARCLAAECDLALLDEPSAYLDVEQRLVVSKVIESIADLRGISVMVVDHDLLFVDNVSDRLLVFEGEPAQRGVCTGPHAMEDGMNGLLSELSITLRRDELSGRPRINKPGSQKDQEQKKSGKYYYA